MIKTSTLLKYLAVTALVISPLCQADSTIWLSDNVAWSPTAAALQKVGLDVKDAKEMGENSGIVLRVYSMTNDLRTPMGTPFGDHATAADIFYHCSIGSGFVNLASGIRVGSYAFTGRSASQLTGDFIAAHVDTATQALRQDADRLQALEDDCNTLRRMAAASSESQKAAVKSKNKK